MHDFEKLGAFYLGRHHDLEADRTSEEPLLYDAKDLTTHAACLGMTGSGKTGLCLSLLEEAALDGVPAIAIDPKGDLGNLLLSFPELKAADFAPWVDEGEAARRGRTREQHAGHVATTWREGLARWGQDGARIARFRQAVDLAIYTPGSNAGLPLAPLRSFDAPAARLDPDDLRDRVTTAVSGLLALVGIDADPLRSREHVLLSNLLERTWSEGRSADLPRLIQDVQAPPFDRVGVFDLETFYPARDRLELAMRLNALLAAPGFSAWMEGAPLDPGSLLHDAHGRPRLSIISIAHLSDAERMFFVTLLLNEVVAWTRSQPGTSSLRAILYMDEVMGYLPPTAKPPSKAPMLTLLKQARAFGVGCVLATQNPVDLDYKALSNTGTWFLGRLQTERDKERVLDGLEGVHAGAWPREKLDSLLSGLKSRVFLMNDVHEEAPAVFHTRWAMSYLRGPLTRHQVERLMAGRKAAAADDAASSPRAGARGPGAAAGASLGSVDGDGPEARRRGPAASTPAGAADAGGSTSEAPRLPNVPVDVLPLHHPLGEGRLVYRPALLARAKLHHASARAKVDDWREVALLASLPDDRASSIDWSRSARVDEPQAAMEAEPRPGATFAEPPTIARRADSWASWEKDLKKHLYQEHELQLWWCRDPKAYSRPGETEADFRSRLAQVSREERDLEVEKLRAKWATKLARLKERVRKAEARVEREQEQYGQQKLQAAISVGASVLGALLGRRALGRATTAARGVSRSARQRGDIERARETLEEEARRLEQMQAEFEDEVAQLSQPIDPAALELEELPVRPRKSDIDVQRMALAWCPWRVDAVGIAEPLWRDDGASPPRHVA